MVESVAGEAIPVKQRRISELTDDDVYTFVSLENTEFLFKEGSYANVYENYSLSSDVNASQTGNNNRMDGWASLLMDDAGNSIYAPVNMLCLWRRSGQGVPQGGVVILAQKGRPGGGHALVVTGHFRVHPVGGQQVDIALPGQVEAVPRRAGIGGRPPVQGAAADGTAE